MDQNNTVTSFEDTPEEQTEDTAPVQKSQKGLVFLFVFLLLVLGALGTYIVVSRNSDGTGETNVNVTVTPKVNGGITPTDNVHFVTQPASDTNTPGN
jgi:hypothetical protein